MSSFRITQLERVERDGESHWTAVVSNGRERVEVHNRLGSWVADDRDGRPGYFHEVKRDVAAALSRKTGKIERREARAEKTEATA